MQKDDKNSIHTECATLFNTHYDPESSLGVVLRTMGQIYANQQQKKKSNTPNSFSKRDFLCQEKNGLRQKNGLYCIFFPYYRIAELEDIECTGNLDPKKRFEFNESDCNKRYMAAVRALKIFLSHNKKSYDFAQSICGKKHPALVSAFEKFVNNELLNDTDKKKVEKSMTKFNTDNCSSMHPAVVNAIQLLLSGKTLRNTEMSPDEAAVQDKRFLNNTIVNQEEVDQQAKKLLFHFEQHPTDTASS